MGIFFFENKDYEYIILDFCVSYIFLLTIVIEHHSLIS
jgi:hypothetical protein